MRAIDSPHAPLAFVTIARLADGIVVAAVVADPSRPKARIGLLFVAVGFGTVALVVVLLIHQRRPVSVWLLASLLPALVGAYFCLAT
jgi:hypothetical protein